MPQSKCTVCLRPRGNEHDENEDTDGRCYAHTGEAELELECVKLALVRFRRLEADAALHAPRGGLLQTSAHDRMAVALERIADSLDGFGIGVNR